MSRAFFLSLWNEQDPARSITYEIFFPVLANEQLVSYLFFYLICLEIGIIILTNSIAWKESPLLPSLLSCSFLAQFLRVFGFVSFCFLFWPLHNTHGCKNFGVGIACHVEDLLILRFSVFVRSGLVL